MSSNDDLLNTWHTFDGSHDMRLQKTNEGRAKPQGLAVDLSHVWHQVQWTLDWSNSPWKPMLYDLKGLHETIWAFCGKTLPGPEGRNLKATNKKPSQWEANAPKNKIILSNQSRKTIETYDTWDTQRYICKHVKTSCCWVRRPSTKRRTKSPRPYTDTDILDSRCRLH